MLVFDTYEDSELHEDAKRMLEGADSWVLPGIVVHEYVWALRGLKAGLSFAKEKVEEYVLSDKATFSTDTQDDILFATRETSSFSRYNDYLILSHAKRIGAPLLTFDADLKRDAKKVGVRPL
ncbi:MAG: PIN domain-containing protein [Nitrososphaerota archaeon]|nr:PIN domain-containing protein [Nitrososphaerota archaeon]